MAAPRRLGFCIDESFSDKLADILLELKAPGAPGIRSVRGLGLTSTSDEVLIAALAADEIGALIGRDSSMLSASVRRDVWRVRGVSLFLCDGKWGNLRLFEQARRLLWWWPEIVAQAGSGPQGGAWRVPADMKPGTLKQLFAEPSQD
jgi:hypothetical protein